VSTPNGMTALAFSQAPIAWLDTPKVHDRARRCSILWIRGRSINLVTSATAFSTARTTGPHRARTVDVARSMLCMELKPTVSGQAAFDNCRIARAVFGGRPRSRIRHSTRHRSRSSEVIALGQVMHRASDVGHGVDRCVGCRVKPLSPLLSWRSVTLNPFCQARDCIASSRPL
jgi:hypothetical protein